MPKRIYRSAVDRTSVEQVVDLDRDGPQFHNAAVRQAPAMVKVNQVGLTSMLDVSRYPDQPLVYQRPFLRAVLGAACLFALCLLLRLVLLPAVDDSEAVWWLPPVLAGLLCGAYQYITARLVVDGTHAHIRNATVSASVPLGHVVEVETGADLVIVTHYKRFHCTGVEAGAFQVATGNLPSQNKLRDAILNAAARAGNAEAPPAIWRPRPPMPLTVALLLVGIVGAVIVAVNQGALPS